MGVITIDRPEALDNTTDDPTGRAPLILGRNDYATLNDKVCAILEAPKPPRAWYVAVGVASSLTAVLGAMVLYLITTGVGVWGLNKPISWGFDITNFVFWVGIGHADADLRHSVPVPAELADVDQPLRRGDDDLRRDVRAPLPDHPRRADLAPLLGLSGAEPDGGVAQLPLAGCSSTVERSSRRTARTSRGIRPSWVSSGCSTRFIFPSGRATTS